MCLCESVCVCVGVCVCVEKVRRNGTLKKEFENEKYVKLRRKQVKTKIWERVLRKWRETDRNEKDS